MGCLYKRGNVWWIKYSRNGRPYFESSRSKKKKDAASMLRLREGDIEKGLPITPTIGRLTFDHAVGDVIAEYTANRRRSLDVVQRRITKHLTPFFGRRRMAAITTNARAHVHEPASRGRGGPRIRESRTRHPQAGGLAGHAGWDAHGPAIHPDAA